MAEAVEGSTEIMQCSAGLGLYLLAAIAMKSRLRDSQYSRRDSTDVPF